jgi:hypothetical protein
LLVKSLKHYPFHELAKRVCALYNEEQDTLLLGMLGQEYEIRHDGIFVRGQKAPESHGAVILDYLFSKGTVGTITPWRAVGDFGDVLMSGFRKKVEEPISSFTGKIITRANSLLPMLDAKPAPSLIGSDLAVTVRALPKVFLHLELSQETQDFPSEAWMLFSNNANEFLTVPNLHVLAEIFKDRLLGLLRIY